MPELLTISKRFLEWARALPETVIPAGLETDMQEAIARAESQLTPVAADLAYCPHCKEPLVTVGYCIHCELSVTPSR